MKRKILKINNMCEQNISEALFEETACAVFCEEKAAKNKEISLALALPELMRALNVKYRGKDSLTDVLAFPLQEKMGPAKHILGEIIICVAVAEMHAKERGHLLEDELVLLVIHGILHLLGYTDEVEDERELMRAKEKKIIKKLGKKEQIV